MSRVSLRAGGYALPNALRDYDDELRSRNADVPGLTDAELVIARFEAEHLVSVLARDARRGQRHYVFVARFPGFITAGAWVFDRLERIQHETTARRRSTCRS